VAQATQNRQGLDAPRPLLIRLSTLPRHRELLLDALMRTLLIAVGHIGHRVRRRWASPSMGSVRSQYTVIRAGYQVGNDSASMDLFDAEVGFTWLISGYF